MRTNVLCAGLVEVTAAMAGAIAVALLAPAAAHAQFVKATITIENATYTPPGGSPQPVSVPILVTSGPPGGCGVGNGGTLAVAVVNNGIDVIYNGAAFGCTVGTGVSFDVVLDVPVVSQESAAFIYLVPEVVSTNLVNAPWVPSARGQARIGFDSTAGSSTQIPLRFDTDFPDIDLVWDVDSTATLDFEESATTRILPMFPGDQVRFRVSLGGGLTSPPGGGSLVGTITTRFEFRTRLPQPVSTLPPAMSIPIGAIGLAGLAVLRG